MGNHDVNRAVQIEEVVFLSTISEFTKLYIHLWKSSIYH